MKISNKLETNMQRFEKLLRPDINFDVVYRVIRVGGRNACIYFIDGFTKDDTLLRILQSFVCQTYSSRKAAPSFCSR